MDKFYSGKSIFISGVTGLCGKILLFKLLSEFADLKKIYVLIRSRRNATPDERLKKLLAHEMFDNIRRETPGQISKVQVISGDVSEPDLRICKQDEDDLVENVQIVFHLAASIKFNEPIKAAVNVNLFGTLRMLTLAERMRKLEVFLHCSTSYVHSYQLELCERHYSTNLDPLEVIKTTSEMSDENSLNLYEKQLLESRGYPNTYILTKALTEDLVFDFRNKLPIVVLRPSLVINAVKEPFPGYIDGYTGIMTIFSGVLTGLIQSFFLEKDENMRVTPVDFVTNAALVASLERSQTRAGGISFYNCTSMPENSLTWIGLSRMARTFITAYAPYKKMVWHPSFSDTRSFVVFFIMQQMFQMYGALIFDIVRVICFMKPFMLKLQWKINYAMSILSDFSQQDFVFRSDELQKLFHRLNSDDKARFNFDHTKLDFALFFETAGAGTRRFIFKEGPETLVKAHRKMKLLYVVRLILIASCVGILSTILWFMVKMF